MIKIVVLNLLPLLFKLTLISAMQTFGEPYFQLLNSSVMDLQVCGSMFCSKNVSHAGTCVTINLKHTCTTIINNRLIKKRLKINLANTIAQTCKISTNMQQLSTNLNFAESLCQLLDHLSQNIFFCLQRKLQNEDLLELLVHVFHQVVLSL